jgi:transcriptional regulator with XRE-family HTH domain
MPKKTWKELRNELLSPVEIAEVDRMVSDEILEMDLRAVREMVGLSQEDVAAAADVNQSELSRMERRGDNRISTVRRYIESLGGELELRAVFKDKTVRLSLGPDQDEKRAR